MPIISGTPTSDTLFGTPGDDTIYGYDTIIGDVGINDGDVLSGGDGNDSIIAGNGDDVLSGGIGDDVLDGGAGTDLADYSSALLSVLVDLGTNSADDGDGGTDILLSIENVTGGAGGDILLGDNFDNVLDGGAGYDLLAGNGGADSFVFAAAPIPANADDVGDFSSVNGDKLLLDASYLTGLTQNGPLNPSQFLIGTAANAPDQRIIYDDSTGEVFYDADGDGIILQERIFTLLGPQPLAASDIVVFNAVTANNPPVAIDDVLAATEDTPVTYTAAQLVGNDTDLDLDLLVIDSVTSGLGGTVVLNGDNSVTFTPNLNFNGAADFTYVVSDGNGGTDSGAVTVNVSAVNDAPVANDDTLSATEDTPVTYAAADLLGNDTDVDGADTLSILSVEGGEGAVLNGDGSVTFTPGANVNGPVSFDYVVSDGNGGTDTGTVFVNVAAVNDAPTTAPVTLVAIAEDSGARLITQAELLGNAADVDAGDTLTALNLAIDTGSGSLIDNLDGTWSYTPALNDATSVSFTYDVSDGTATAAGSASLDITPVNDAGPVAVDDILVATEDTPVTYAAADLLGNDTDVDLDTLVIDSVTSGLGGTAVLNGDQTVTFTPNANFNGAADFTYVVSDGTLTDDGAVTVNVSAVNDAPVANDDTLSATEDTPVTYAAADLVGNDTDVDTGDTLTVQSVTSGTGGTVLLNGDGTVTFTPGSNFNGTADFTYVVSDGNGGTDSGSVTVNVAAVNDAGPVAVDDILVATEDTPVTYAAADLLGNDTDVDLDTLTIQSVTSGTGGIAVLNGDNSVTFTPNANFNGAADFTYVVSDGTLTDDGAVTVNVAAVNDAPVANDDTLSATEDTPVTYAAADLLGNDTDVENDTLFILDVTGGEGGSVVLNGDNSVTFTPNADFNGVADFTYTVKDGNDTDSGAVTVNVAAVNDAPVANDDTLSATQDTPVTYAAADLVGNDTDVDLDLLVIDSVTSGTGGTVLLNGDGTVTFTPGAGFTGAADFTYVVSDGTDTDSGAVTVNVAVAGNNPPVAFDDTLSATEDTPVTYLAADLVGNDTDLDLDLLVIDSVTSGTGGTVLLNGDGTVTFTPNLNFNGTADFTYVVSDGTDTDSGAVTVNVAAVNDAPVANDDTLAAMEDTPVTYTAAQLVGNDTDVDLDTLTIQSVTSGLGGSVVLNGDNSVTFTPNLNFNGTADFTYVVSDGTDTDSGAVTVNVAAVNDPPIAQDDVLGTSEDTPVTYAAADLLGNDIDIDGGPLVIQSVASVTNGLAVLNGDGTVTFTPGSNVNGTAVFTYVVSDGAGGTDTGDVFVSIAAVNDAPVANDDTLSASQDTPVTYAANDLLGNDTDVEDDTLSIFSVTSGTGGTAALNGDGTVTFTPGAGFTGAADFTYVVSDGTDTDSGAVTVNVGAPNNAPVAVDDTLSATEDTPVTYAAADLVGNDTDLDLDTLVIDSVTSGTGGTAVLNGDGTVTFTPSADFNGAANFTYVVSDGTDTDTGAVTVNVAAVNDAPVANDDTLSATEDTPVTYLAADLVGNDTDVDLDTLSVVSVTSGGNGTVVLNGDGTVTFTPDSNFSGTAGFTYVVSDGTDTDTGAVTVNVAAVNDAPVANDDTLSATEDTPVTYLASDLIGNDTDIDSGLLVIQSVEGGEGAVLNGDGTVTFTPGLNVNGPVIFNYVVSDGTDTDSGQVTVNVAAVNDAPVANDDTLSATQDTQVTYSAAALVGNDTDVDLDTLVIDSVTSGTGGTAVLNGDNSVTFTPGAGFTGAADFTYVVSDGNGGTDSGAVTVNVTADANNPPLAFDDTLSATEDTPVTYLAADLVGNDTDADDDTLTIQSVASGTGGTAVLNGDGSVTFTPGSNFNGAADFTYVVSDGTDTDSGAVTVNVAAVNDAPVANDDTLSATEDTPVTYLAADLVGNDTDVEDDTLVISSVTSGTGGTAVLNGDGTVTFTPGSDFNGTADFTYVVSDGADTDTGAVTVNVSAVNDAPVANDDTLSATEDTPVTYLASDLLGNDTDADDDTLTISSVASGTGGTAVLNGDGSVTFTPGSDFNGTANFTYVVSDGNDTDTGAVTVNVAAVNDAPVANNDTLSATEDTPVTYAAADLLGNDTDVELDTLEIVSVGSGINGTAVLNGDGTVTFTPDSNFNGTAGFTYLVGDGSETDSGVVVVNVAAVNDAPVANNDTLSATEDTPVTYLAADLVGNDTDVEDDSLVISSVASGNGGTAVLNGDGTVTFTPGSNFFGTADFTYVVSDGNDTDGGGVLVNVAAVNDAPVANDDTLSATEDTPVTYTAAQLVGNDTDVENDTLSVSSVTSGSGGTVVLNGDGTVTFTPGSNFNGTANFTYVVSDGNDTDTGAVTVNVAAVNDAPTVANAIADQPPTTINNAFTFTFAALTFNDVEGDSLTYTATQADDSALPAWLTFTPGTRTFSGTPLVGDIDVIDVKVTANDGNGGSTSEVFTITVVTDDEALTGGTGNDVLSGGTGNDTLTGAAGNDTLDGGAGNDVGFGSAGDDSLQGGTGNDNLQGNAGIDTLIGNAGNDTLDGGADADLIYGSADHDSILGGAAIDTLVGNAGNDTIDGGTENDQVFGSVGNDYVLGGLGADVVQGNGDNDTVIGGDGTGTDTADGNDSLNGGAGNDSLSGGFGNDDLVAGAGFDTLIGNAGNDTMDGGADGDLAYGSSGDDSILGGAAIDTLVGNAGNDVLDGGTENDQVFGSIGDDVVRGGLGADVVQGNAGNDTVTGGDGTGTDTADGNDSLDGGLGNDSLSGGFGADNLLAGGGFDTLIGNAGNDTMDGGADGDLAYGSADNDSIVGGAGIDTLVGNAGNDTLDGGTEDDQVFGSVGNDVVGGGAGNDVVQGNAGFDTIVGGAGNDTMQGNADTDVFRYDAASLNTLDVAAGQADFVNGSAAGDLISMLGLNDELTIGNIALSALTANALVGNALNATNNIAFTGGVLQIDLDGNDTFNALNDFQIQLTGVTSVTYNSTTDQFQLS